MTFNVGWSGIENHEELCFEKDENGKDRLKPLTESLAFMCMNIGVDWGIREENVDEVITRFWIYQKVFGPLLKRWDEEAGEFKGTYISPDDIRAHIGLTVNVAHIKDRSWYANLVRVLKEEAARGIKNYDLNKE